MIGGEHYLTPPARVENSLGEMLEKTTGEMVFFSTGRDALFSLLVSLPHRSIYLPDLVCASVHQACVAAGKVIVSYPLEPELLDSSQLDLQEAQSSCLLVMHYFGVANLPLLSRARQAGITVISDVTHMLFNPRQLAQIAQESDYLIASLRKSGAFPDGGFVSSCLEPLVQATLPIRERFFSLRAAGLLSRGFSAQKNFCDDENFHLLRTAESVIDQSNPGAHQCSYLTRRLLFTVDVDAAALKMNDNMQILAANLKSSCTTPCQPGFTSPYFCCFFRNRKERDFVRTQLAARKYLCPVHWDTSSLPTPSPLSKRCLSIPCDARYNSIDMNDVASIIESCIKI